MTWFEDRHRELRAAWVFPPANFPAQERRSAGDRAEEQLQEFDQRTALLVDDLVAATRDMLNFGEHDGPCERDQDGRCAVHVAATYRREYALKAALAALDEASRA